MQEAALPLLNLAILGGFVFIGLRELSSLKTQAIEVREQRARGE